MGRSQVGRAARLLSIHACRKPDFPAVVSAHGARTFYELYHRSSGIAGAILRADIRPADSVVVTGGNCPEFIEAMIACDRAGVHAVPIASDLSPREIQYILDDARPSAILVTPQSGGLPAPFLSAFEKIPCRFSIGGDLDGFVSLDGAAASGVEATFSEGEAYPLYYTSGTTGRPKAVLRHGIGETPLARRIPEIYAFRAYKDRYLSPPPLTNSGRFAIGAMMPLLAGATVYLTQDAVPVTVLSAIQTWRVSHVYLTPFMMHALMKSESAERSKYDISSLRCVLHGGAPCSMDLKHWALSFFGPIVSEYYGGTEGGGTTATTEEWLANPGTVGRPEHDGDIAIYTEDFKPCRFGTAGKIYLRVPDSARFEYLNDEAKTLAAYHGDYFTMRDYGYLNEAGYLFLTGRDADVINVRGYNVYAEEVDQVIEAHDLVQCSLTFSAPEEADGERIISLIQLNAAGLADVAAALAALKSRVVENLAPYKRPSEYIISDLLPIDGVGKKRRHLARQQYLSASNFGNNKR